MRAQLFLHRNNRFASAFAWIVPVCFLVAKSRLEQSRIDGGVGDDATTACTRNELFGSYDHLSPYSTPLETWLDGD